MNQLTRTLGLATFAAASLTFVGCGIQSGDTLVQYERGDDGDRLVKVPNDGTAALYSGNDLSPVVRTGVEKGDDIGFRDERTTDGGNVIAVAGEFEQKIEQGTVFDRTFYWKIQDVQDDE
ncbi:MAG: hypothetical protein AAGK78_14550 [Planctomycetota bacterium]